jgi:uncharacterized membrane protein
MTIVFIIMLISILLIGILFIEIHIIPNLNPDNKFKIWWKTHIMDTDEDHI